MPSYRCDNGHTTTEPRWHGIALGTIVSPAVIPTCPECEDEMDEVQTPWAADPIAALSREDVEDAIGVLRESAAHAPMTHSIARGLDRVATALAEHLIDRHDA